CPSGFVVDTGTGRSGPSSSPARDGTNDAAVTLAGTGSSPGRSPSSQSTGTGRSEANQADAISAKIGVVSVMSTGPRRVSASGRRDRGAPSDSPMVGTLAVNRPSAAGVGTGPNSASPASPAPPGTDSGVAAASATTGRGVVCGPVWGVAAGAVKPLGTPFCPAR